MHNTQFPEFSIKRLLEHDWYLVPRYQRNYAWTEEHIKQLIDDILDSLVASGKDLVRPYYIGTLVVFPRKGHYGRMEYEVIDGQQRLTTLTLLASYLTFLERKNLTTSNHWYDEIKLDFESRKRSSETLRAAHNGNFHDAGKKTKTQEEYAEEIVDAYEIIQRILPDRCNEKKVSPEAFTRYFFDYVKICRVDVPDDTDLNHYFEIMNNRGEQLEKHEVLKARLLSKLEPGTDQYVFNYIWEACSSMDKYVQYGFPKTIREDLFGRHWNQFLPQTIEDLIKILSKIDVHAQPQSNRESVSHPTIRDLVNDVMTVYERENLFKKEEEEEPERFSSIINFQNFLPHVLSIYLNDGAVILDDKDLLNSFLSLEKSNPEAIKEFSFVLLKMRFLFDQNIIKRDAKEDEREWSLKELHLTEQKNPSYRSTYTQQTDGENLQRQITLLQSMFHVSVPSRPYKYWLQGALRFLFRTEGSTAVQFKDYLLGLAQAFVYNRFLAPSPLEYETLIFKNEGKPISSHQIDEEKTKYGAIENILVFNFIDYVLWSEKRQEDSKIRDFVFTFRSSVEHYYPQNPIDGNPLRDTEALHCIGNLCLISHSKNSLLRHHLPKAKAEYYLKQSYIDSVLQYMMLEQAEMWSNDPVTAIRKQENMVIQLLKSNMP